jgi:hypothetical protein
MQMKFYRNVLLKALLLFLVFNLVLMNLPPVSNVEQPSIYNVLVPGRLRFPFGENPQQAYNFSLYDVDAMFAAHQVRSAAQKEDVVHVFVFGDSSVWGTLLTPQETLTGQLNQLALTCNNSPLEFYNLGYPTISVSKDLMLMEHAKVYQPEMVLWLTTLEALPLDKQLASPLAANNSARIDLINEKYQLDLEVPDVETNWWSKTLWGQRRAYADWIRLQLYGIPWAATGIDQVYPAYQPAAWDLEADRNYYEYTPPKIPDGALLYPAFEAGKKLWGETPLMLVNEPIMISGGENSDVRYNFFYPRWAYDQYRQTMADLTDNQDIDYVDAWDWVSAQDFTNSAIHMNAAAEAGFAERLAVEVLKQVCP